MKKKACDCIILICLIFLSAIGGYFGISEVVDRYEENYVPIVNASILVEHYNEESPLDQNNNGIIDIAEVDI